MRKKKTGELSDIIWSTRAGPGAHQPKAAGRHSALPLAAIEVLPKILLRSIRYHIDSFSSVAQLLSDAADFVFVFFCIFLLFQVESFSH